MPPLKYRVKKAYEEDKISVKNEIMKHRCLHCGKKYRHYDCITEVRLTTGQVIWWHARPSCTPDDEYEKTN